MKSGNFIELTFAVKGGYQVELINVEHISRIMYAGDKLFIGMPGQTCTRQLTETSLYKLSQYINIENNKLEWLLS